MIILAAVFVFGTLIIFLLGIKYIVVTVRKNSGDYDYLDRKIEYCEKLIDGRAYQEDKSLLNYQIQQLKNQMEKELKEIQ